MSSFLNVQDYMAIQSDIEELVHKLIDYIETLETQLEDKDCTIDDLRYDIENEQSSTDMYKEAIYNALIHLKENNIDEVTTILKSAVNIKK